MRTLSTSSPRARRRIARYRQQLQASPSTSTTFPMRKQASLWSHLWRFSLVLSALITIFWSWQLMQVFLAGQRAHVSQHDPQLLDLHQAYSALTPDNIEHKILSLSLELQEPGLQKTPDGDPVPKPFTIGIGEPTLYIAYRLENAGLVTSAELFNLYMRVHHLDRHLEAGNYMLSATMTIPELATALQQPSYEEEVVTLFEGMRIEEFAELLAEHFVIEAEPFLEAVRQPQTLNLVDDYSFLADLPEGASLEGYLFPDTYRFPVATDDPEVVIAKFLDNFARKIGGHQLEGSRTGLSRHELVTLASIIEREARLAIERPLIASVYVNRIKGDCTAETGRPFLESDPTVQYPLGNADTGWWPPIQIADYNRVNSLYNTFLYPGLPPGPIANPGLSALQAAYEPAQSVYCYFHTMDIDGRHAFARTYAEHQQNVLRYGGG